MLISPYSHYTCFSPQGPSSGSTDTFYEKNIFNYMQVYNLHVNMFFLPDIDIWTRIFLPCSRSVSVLPGDGPLRAKTCGSVRV